MKNPCDPHKPWLSSQPAAFKHFSTSETSSSLMAAVLVARSCGELFGQMAVATSAIPSELLRRGSQQILQ